MCHGKAAPLGRCGPVWGCVCGRCAGRGGGLCGLPRMGMAYPRCTFFAGPRRSSCRQLARRRCPDRLQTPAARSPTYAVAHGDALPCPDTGPHRRTDARTHGHDPAQRRAGAAEIRICRAHPQRDPQTGQRRRLCAAGGGQHQKQHRG